MYFDKILIHEIIPRFGLPLSLQSDNGSAFKAAVTQGVSKALVPEFNSSSQGISLKGWAVSADDDVASDS